ncbi:MAG: DNA repair and recombination protein RadA [Crenarchaeota archaeon]|nr:DNA repair and recombination protein RadA [Thermoproteota archaeon]MCR8454840.1 DNA repair and recombination protein RadA [Thermoproteota archaeon]MCR8487780.1 DNA repair and recombination protein RadA [Thermoproteota archaeon]MCR8501709.1 DNA repair and recombination protein RadA [Thermoproteota archaeon]
MSSRGSQKRKTEPVESSPKEQTPEQQDDAMKILTSLAGVGKATAQKLISQGYTNLEIIAVTPPKILEVECQLSPALAEKIVQQAREHVGLDFISARDMLQIRKNVKRLTTGSKALDDLLGGGIETQAITEFYGEYRVGKTQICFTLATTVQLPEEKGGLNGKCLFIDTEGTFRPERIIPIAQRFGLDPDDALDKIIVARVFSTSQQMEVAKIARKLIKKENIRLIIVDSLTALFRSEYVGIDQLAIRQQQLNVHIHDLARLAWAFNLAVVVTNQVMANPGAFFGPQMSAIGGHIVAHHVTHRLHLRKAKGDKRIARVEDSPYLPESEVVFRIAYDGIRDAEEDLEEETSTQE